ncbi:protein FAM47E-like [Ursus americanus]|uniref:protein FAM47E-like n=1 Tax=Ursus americanus TaxID=9643 RepID=UPI001E67C577|nr:protein FAM47E-like [Ursus americanus]
MVVSKAGAVPPTANFRGKKMPSRQTATVKPRTCSFSLVPPRSTRPDGDEGRGAVGVGRRVPRGKPGAQGGAWAGRRQSGPRSPSDAGGREYTRRRRGCRSGAEETMAEPRRLCGPAAPTRGPAGGTCGPRYKENLPSKCLTKHRHRPPFLNSLQWTFVKKGLDDFRRGCPPYEGLITRGPQEAFLPQIHHTAPRPAPKKRQHKWPQEAALFSKLSPAQQVRKAFLADAESQVALHPLALYPNLGEDMPVELLLKVLEVLDPDRKLEDTWAYCQGVGKRTKEPAKLLKKRSTQVDLGLPKKTPVSHPGQWLYEEKKPSETDLLHEDGPLPHENVRKGVRDFCDWATAFGSSNIDEEFILKQFDIGSQSKPSLDVPLAMRLSQAPLELKKRPGLEKLQGPQFSQKLDHEQKHQKPQNPHKPKCVKMRYGAWYLDTKLWKKQRADEPLVDPKGSCKAQDENLKKELQEQEELLADLHGTTAFKDFILSRGYEMPSFLEKMCIRKERKCECNKTSIK